MGSIIGMRCIECQHSQRIRDFIPHARMQAICSAYSVKEINRLEKAFLEMIQVQTKPPLSYITSARWPWKRGGETLRCGHCDVCHSTRFRFPFLFIRPTISSCEPFARRLSALSASSLSQNNGCVTPCATWHVPNICTLNNNSLHIPRYHSNKNCNGALTSRGKPGGFKEDGNQLTFMSLQNIRQFKRLVLFEVDYAEGWCKRRGFTCVDCM